MDMVERRVREIFASVLSVGARLLERTAGELERASSQLRHEQRRRRLDVDRVWSDDEERTTPGRVTRGAPLRAVPTVDEDEGGPDAAPSGGSVLAPSGEEAVGGTEDLVTDPAATQPASDDLVTDPAATGSAPEDLVTDPVAADAAGPADALESDTARTARLEELATGTVSQIRPQLAELSPDELRRLRDIEAAGRNRSTLLAAIDRALAEG